MRPTTLRALERAAVLTRADRFTEAVAVAERAINAAEPHEHAEIRQWLTDHADDFVTDPKER